MSHQHVICVVDDDDEVRESVDTFFRSAGIVVAKFSSAQELLAWPILPQMRCLITDVHMPDMDGLELIGTLLARNLSVPFIIMTAFPSEGVTERAKALDVTRVFAKPTDPDSLLEVVESILASYEKSSE